MVDVLDGIRVVDFGRYIAGPYCGALLGDLGAEVIRVDAERGELAVRFVDLAEEDAERLDRAVLAELSAQRSATG